MCSAGDESLKAAVFKVKTCDIIFDAQWGKLFPFSGDPPDTQTSEITLWHLLIRKLYYLPPPITGWIKMPAEGDEVLLTEFTNKHS